MLADGLNVTGKGTGESCHWSILQSQTIYTQKSQGWEGPSRSLLTQTLKGPLAPQEVIIPMLGMVSG